MPAHIKKKLPKAVLIALFIFLFFYRLDYNTLTNWNDGWYTSMARQIVKTENFMNLSWNGRPYYYHLPLGFWLMPTSFKLFGIAEFSTRFLSAILGLLSILSFAFFILLVCPWYKLHFNTHLDFFQQHFVNISNKNKTLASFLSR